MELHANWWQSHHELDSSLQRHDYTNPAHPPVRRRCYGSWRCWMCPSWVSMPDPRSLFHFRGAMSESSCRHAGHHFLHGHLQEAGHRAVNTQRPPGPRRMPCSPSCGLKLGEVFHLLECIDHLPVLRCSSLCKLLKGNFCVTSSSSSDF